MHGHSCFFCSSVNIPATDRPTDGVAPPQLQKSSSFLARNGRLWRALKWVVVLSMCSMGQKMWQSGISCIGFTVHTLDVTEASPLQKHMQHNSCFVLMSFVVIPVMLAIHLSQRTLQKVSVASNFVSEGIKTFVSFLRIPIYFLPPNFIWRAICRDLKNENVAFKRLHFTLFWCEWSITLPMPILKKKDDAAGETHFNHPYTACALLLTWTVDSGQWTSLLVDIETTSLVKFLLFKTGLWLHFMPYMLHATVSDG